MLSSVKVKWAREWLRKNPLPKSSSRWRSSSGRESDALSYMIAYFNETPCCGLIELDGWSDRQADYNNRNKALFYSRLAAADEALVYATTTPNQIHAETFLKEAGFKPAARGKSWKTNNIITIWTLALRSVKARDNPEGDTW